MISLRTRLGQVRRRLLSIGSAAAAVWALAAATMLLLLGAWLDLLWELSPEWRIATFWAAGASGALLLGALAAMTVRAARDAAVARRIDRAGDGYGRVLTGWELEQEWGGHSCPPKGRQECRPHWLTSPLSAGLASLAIADAAAAAGDVPLAKVAPVRPLGRSLAGLGALWAVVVVLALCLPSLARTQWNRFVRPFADVPPFSRSEFKVSPGNKAVLYGSELEIRATVTGAPVEQLELVLESAQGQEPPLPMFPEANGQWRAVLARVVEPADYFVRAYRARSEKYHISVITVPLIDGARLRIVPPDYANRAAYEGPMPKDGVSGLPGTKVQVFLRSNRPLRGGTITVWGGRPGRAKPGETPATPGKPAVFAMDPTEPGGQEVAGQFSIAGDGKFECRVIDEAGQPSKQSFSGNVIMLADERPFIRITQPQKTSLATPTALLPVTLSAEDDCGISRLQLFRSLNDSRPLAFDLKLPPRPSRRLDESVRLPLGRYGLEPGDVIKLFGRVEDNDPAGAKGAESSVVTVRIVSQEEFEQMLRTREGIQALLSKYHAAQRRMEGMAKEVEGLRKKLKTLPPGEKRSEETRRELGRLERLMRQEAEALRKSAQSPLPYDLDKNLAPQLEQLAKLSEEMAKELEKLQQERDLLNKKLAGRLDEMAKRLSSGRKLYDEQASQPLELLEAVFPLLADQQRFIMLAQWQRDLAERLASMKGRDGEDNPAMKARMRDLEQEQRQIRDAFADFLDKMQEHLDKVPDKPELAKLRQTAKEFIKDVRASGASDAMAAAETALAEFAPTRAGQKAKEAADILDKFVKRCNGVGNCACQGLAFQPRLSSGLGNTLAQLLAGMGSGNGMGGYSATGLYGGLPDMLDNAGDTGDSRADVEQQTAAGHGRPRGENPDDAGSGDLFAPGAATGASEGAVPVRYRRQVGEYFQRVAEETGETGH